MQPRLRGKQKVTVGAGESLVGHALVENKLDEAAF